MLEPSAASLSFLEPVLTASAMREADRYTIETFGIPGFTLMETAGRGAAAVIEAYFGPLAGKTVACYCGKGNNGGDGLVVARVLYEHGARVRVVLLADEDDMTSDAAQNLRLLRALKTHDTENRLDLLPLGSVDALADLPPSDLHIDALLGTGLTSALRDPVRSLVDWINAQPQPTVALDVPTGLNSDDGTAPGVAVEAELTVTMGALKAGLLLGEGPRLAGRIEVVEIGIPAFVLEQAAATPGCARRTTDAPIRTWLPERAHDANKYSAGLALVVAGAPGMTGAPVMAATAAARVGAGYVVCACHETIQPTLSVKLTEVTTIALPDADGGIAPEASLEALRPRLEKAQALLVGCGLGRHPETQRFVRLLLESATCPVVVDADGLNALARHTDWIEKHARGNWILTPHMGEFRRLAGNNVDATDRIRTVQAYARRWNCVLVLKGLPSVTGWPDGQVYVNGTGNPALATAGTGDVLAGMCAGLLAQGVSPGRAAVAALHLGGAAADRYVRRHGSRSMMATDLLRHLPPVLRERFC